MKKTICSLVAGLMLGFSGCKKEEPKWEDYAQKACFPVADYGLFCARYDEKNKLVAFVGSDSRGNHLNLYCLYMPGNQRQCSSKVFSLPMDDQIRLSVSEVIQSQRALTYQIAHQIFKKASK